MLLDTSVADICRMTRNTCKGMVIEYYAFHYDKGVSINVLQTMTAKEDALLPMCAWYYGWLDIFIT
jgi:hypothetical protein